MLLQQHHACCKRFTFCSIPFVSLFSSRFKRNLFETLEKGVTTEERRSQAEETKHHYSDKRNCRFKALFRPSGSEDKVFLIRHHLYKTKAKACEMQLKMDNKDLEAFCKVNWFEFFYIDGARLFHIITNYPSAIAPPLSWAQVYTLRVDRLWRFDLRFTPSKRHKLPLRYSVVTEPGTAPKVYTLCVGRFWPLDLRFTPEKRHKLSFRYSVVTEPCTAPKMYTLCVGKLWRLDLRFTPEKRHKLHFRYSVVTESGTAPNVCTLL
ncbi:hypothetical protein AVEN_164409-1 [Araneus ventricosus]|uniref:Uncharacterized protein n=1 Tax=Araneus ventricosus TaxID=182803 RepID=A0A4Y2GTQ8_ARAVE|nr:hypothetical protein AVEN_164409-1 [Araneus ventricosus]